MYFKRTHCLKGLQSLLKSALKEIRPRKCCVIGLGSQPITRWSKFTPIVEFFPLMEWRLRKCSVSEQRLPAACSTYKTLLRPAREHAALHEHCCLTWGKWRLNNEGFGCLSEIRQLYQRLRETKCYMLKSTSIHLTYFFKKENSKGMCLVVCCLYF